jgi:hypothetical protein
MYSTTLTLQTGHKEVIVARIVHCDSDNLTAVSNEGDFKIVMTYSALKPV